MCGLIGMAGTLERKHADLMADALLVCQVRGRDSTGIFKVSTTDQTDWITQLGTPDFLTQSRTYAKRIESGPAKVLAGHCRSATAGPVTIENAHPFEHGEITGVHNGTLRNWKQEEGAKDFDVDSDWLYWHISEFGEEETFSKLDAASAYACIWYDEGTKRLNFIRNDKRPLWFTWSDDMKVMFWASEIWMLGVIQRDKGVSFWDGGKEGNVYFPLPTDTLWSCSVEHTYLKDKSSLTMKAPKIIKQKEPVVGNFTHRRGGSKPWDSSNKPSYATGDDWELNEASGLWQRKKPSTSLTVVKGGEVTSPFQDDDIDDLINTKDSPSTLFKKDEKEGNSKTVGESTTSKHTAQASKTPSSSLTGTVEDTKLGKSSGRPTLSLVSKTSNVLQQDNKEPLSNSLKKRVIPHISLRNCVGSPYITNNTTGKELREDEFDKLTGSICSFCDGMIGGLEEVHSFLSTDSKKFICTTCVEPRIVRTV